MTRSLGDTIILLLSTICAANAGYIGPCGGTLQPSGGGQPLCCNWASRVECEDPQNTDCDCVTRPQCVEACQAKGNCNVIPGAAQCEERSSRTPFRRARLTA